MKTSIATVGFTLALAGTLVAQQPPAPPPPGAPSGGQGPMTPMRGPRGVLPVAGPGMGIYAPDRLVDRRDLLDLSADQVSRLDALAQVANQARDKAEADAKPHWDRLAELWKQPSPDVAEITQHAQAAMQAMEAAHLAQLTAQAQAKAVLTPEQRGRVAGWGDGARRRMRQGGRMHRGVGPGMRGRMQRMRRPSPSPGR